ncbi:hypothetical protein PYCCODRAFT_1371726 [Trametes coccinea BRFM310]|uniref:Cap-specific mRNA (nucleoside-2'-O-)-methyltransferase 1 n=1 Tax=Trametes coccinea (strain BRFM310) TaxID=1353009 RepID=A0A1Y2IG60_TRAC3|nr:hypothetical protein PYCCODRAFT_1371726 [Trametes coccinea BRFM310]
MYRRPVHLESKLNSSAVLSRCEVEELRELRRLRARGWTEDGLDKHFVSQRQSADEPPVQSQHYWYREMANVMAGLNTVADFIPKCGSLNFLDLGCAPGGFSLHVLRTNPEAKGVGLSLSKSQGGHAFLLDESYQSRFEHKEQDLLEYDLLPETCHAVESPRITLPTAFLSHFDLVIIDGHPLRTYRPANPSNPDPSATTKPYGFALLLTQLISALCSVRPGGTIVAKMFHIECYPAAHLIYLLDIISDSLMVHKPSRIHATRASFYVVAKGVAREPERARLMEQYLDGLKALWHDLECGGSARAACSAKSHYEDLDFIVKSEDILDMDGYLPRLIELGRPVWGTQAKALRQFFNRKGLSDLPTAHT